MKNKNLIILSKLWLKDLLKRPLTYILTLIFIVAISQSTLKSFFLKPDHLKFFYFCAISIPFLTIILNSISADYISGLAFKDGLFYYLLAAPLSVKEILISQVIATVLFNLICLFIFLIFVGNSSIYYILTSPGLFVIFANSIIFYIILTLFEFYIYFKYPKIAFYMQRFMLIILIIFWLYFNFVTDGFQKENNFLLKLPYIFVLLDIIIIYVLKTDKIKRGMQYE
jgi:hypothetical protein